MQFKSIKLIFLIGLLLAGCTAPTPKKPNPAAKGQLTPAQAAAMFPATAPEAVDVDTSAVLDGLKAPVSEEEPPSQAPKPDQAAGAQAYKIVRVLLADNQSEAEIKHSGRVYIYTQNLDKKYKVSAAGTLAVRFAGNGQVQVGSLKTNQPVILEPAKDTLLTWKDNVYAGKIFILPAQHTFLLIEHVDLETYLYGVLPYEMSYSWPIEALKAQAVAARTYTLKTIEHSKKTYFDLYSDVRSQMYKGGGKQYPSVKTAVDATQNQVLMYEGKLFYTYYHGNCGGGTDDVHSWNPAAKTIKPLAGASCAYDSHSKNHSWKQDIPNSKIISVARGVGLGGTLKNVKVAQKTHTGRATKVTIQTSKGSKTVSCNKFRLAIGLKSCKIKKINMLKGSTHIEGSGYGHGIGMCQDGANGMAKAGKTYEQILKNYYPGSKLTPLTK